MLYRRTLLKSAALAATSSVLPSSLLAQAVSNSASSRIHKAIPSSGELIPVVGIGTNHYGHGIGEGNDAQLIAPLREVISKYAELGGGLIDTSTRYRNSEDVLGNLFAELGLNDQFMIATKISSDDVSESREQMIQSAQKLHSDVLDIVYVHNLRAWQVNLPMLREAKQEGIIRYYGISTADIPEYDEVVNVMNTMPLDFVQVNYSLRQRDAEQEILKVAADKGIGIVVNRAFDQGRLFSDVSGHEVPDWASEFDAASWGQVFLKYVISHPAAVCTIPGTTKIHHLIDNIGAAQGRLPTAEQRMQIEKHYASIVG